MRWSFGRSVPGAVAAFALGLGALVVPAASAGAVVVEGSAPEVTVVSLTASRTVVTTGPQSHTPATYTLVLKHAADVSIERVLRLRMVWAPCLVNHSAAWCNSHDGYWTELRVFENATKTKLSATTTQLKVRDSERIDLRSGVARERPGTWRLLAAGPHSIETLGPCKVDGVAQRCWWSPQTLTLPAKAPAVKLVYGTRTSAKVSATRVAKGRSVTVSGKVSRLVPVAGGNPRWGAHRTAKVAVVFNPAGKAGPRTVVKSVKVAADGSFRVKVKLTTSGTLTVKDAADAGRFLRGSSSKALKVTVR